MKCKILLPMFFLALFTACAAHSPNSVPIDPKVIDRSHLSLYDALAGHWYSKLWDKNEYYFKTDANDVFLMTWDSRGGKDTSKSETRMEVYSVDEKNNQLTLTYKSDDGKTTYFSTYTFSSDRTRLTDQYLDASLKPSNFVKAYDLIFVNAESKSPYLEMH